MTSEALLCCLASIMTQCSAAAFLALLSDQWRFPLRKCVSLLLALSALIALLQVLFFLYFSLNTANLLAMLTDVLALLLAPFLFHWGRGRLLFSMAITYSFAFTTIFFSHMLFQQIGPAHLAARAVISALTFLFLWRWFAPCLRSAFRIEISGWYALALIPLLFSLIFFILTFGKFSVAYTLPDRPFPGIPDLTVHYILLVFPTCTYFALYSIFRALLQCYSGFRENAELSSQVSALKAQEQYESKLQQAYAQLLSTLDGDLREVDCLVHSGALASALSLSERAEGRIATLMKGAARRRFTDVPVLDAVLSDYTAAAEADGVSFTLQFALPEAHELDLSALSVVLSNALENALNACRAQAPGRPREIRLLTSVRSGQFFLLLENSCDTPVVFDGDGYPVSCQPGHGYGTRSIAAFAQQRNGIFRYHWYEERFSLQLLV